MYISPVLGKRLVSVPTADRVVAGANYYRPSTLHISTPKINPLKGHICLADPAVSTSLYGKVDYMKHRDTKYK